uniref:hypothetical protein n=1 Tax=Flavobacterium sp. TaxID=239 RepID=UPI0040497CB6
MKENNQIKIIEQNSIPIISFIGGTFLLLFFATSQKKELVVIGLIYVFIALIINSIYSLFLMYKLFKNSISKNEFLLRIGIALLNIPIAILYLYIISQIITINSKF